MAYPNILYKGQYTLKRVLTMPADPSLTIADIGKLVTLEDATGNVVIAGDQEGFFGVLRTINEKDNVATVDFSGVHEFTASGAINAGDSVLPSGTTGGTVVVNQGSALTACVALTPAADGEKIQVFFLN